MKTYNEFLQLDEGRNAKIRAAKKANPPKPAVGKPSAMKAPSVGKPLKPPSAMVHVPGKGRTDKEGVLRRPSGSRPPGTSGVTTPTTKRRGLRDGALAKYRAAARKKQQPANQNPTSLKTIQRRASNPGKYAQAVKRKAGMNFKKDPIGTAKKVGGKALGAAKWVGAEGRSNVKSAAADSASASEPKGQTVSKMSA